ncbi:prostamide/prostaglandin F synthase, partial [Oryctolagus cuniculus]|uniref:prostamide/prostaglandin F synthase n=1 Tax=Oryctolagus cuniculus TaxID=9986 RepID=UPI00387903CB
GAEPGQGSGAEPGSGRSRGRGRGRSRGRGRGGAGAGGGGGARAGVGAELEPRQARRCFCRCNSLSSPPAALGKLVRDVAAEVCATPPRPRLLASRGSCLGTCCRAEGCWWSAKKVPRDCVPRESILQALGISAEVCASEPPQGSGACPAPHPPLLPGLGQARSQGPLQGGGCRGGHRVEGGLGGRVVHPWVGRLGVPGVVWEVTAPRELAGCAALGPWSSKRLLQGLGRPRGPCLASGPL